MGSVWEPYGKGVPFLGAPGNSLEIYNRPMGRIWEIQAKDVPPICPRPPTSMDFFLRRCDSAFRRLSQSTWEGFLPHSKAGFSCWWLKNMFEKNKGRQNGNSSPISGENNTSILVPSGTISIFFRTFWGLKTCSLQFHHFCHHFQDPLVFADMTIQPPRLLVDFLTTATGSGNSCEPGNSVATSATKLLQL